jgi:alpha/beta superfamily hydrolase
MYFEVQVIIRRSAVKTDYKKQFIISVSFLLLFFVAACGSTPTPVVETAEATGEVEIELTATGSPTPEPPTPTPEPPTLTPLPSDTPTPAPIFEYSIETVSLTTEDDIELEGILFRSEGDTAVVFAHMAGGDNDQQNWVPFAKQVARRGFTALTFNFRCYGESDCGGRDSGSILLSRDVGAAIDFLREQGFERVVCAGASMGGRGCVNVAFDRELDGIIIVAGTGSSDPDRQDLADFLTPNMPKLFIVSENDHIADRTLAMTTLYESAPEPKTFVTYPSTAHGTELFDTRYAEAFREAIFSFLYEIHSTK